MSPVVSVVGPASGSSPVTLTGSATDYDGTIASEVWSIVSATNNTDAAITQAGVLTATQTDTAVDTVVTYQYCATDNDGAETCVQGTYTIPAVVVACEDYELTIPVTESYIQNADFNSYSSLPDSLAQLDRADNWEQFSHGTSDYLHSSGFMGDTAPSPDAGGYVGFIFNRDEGYDPDIGSNIYYEYVSQTLATALVAGETYRVTLLVGGGAIDTNYAADLDRKICLYGLPSVPTKPVTIPHPNPAPGGSSTIGYLHIDQLDVNAVKLAEKQLTVQGDNWEIITFEFTPTFDVLEFVFGGEATSGGAKYMCIDKLLLAKTESFTCPN